MDVKEAVIAAFKEMILPEVKTLQQDVSEIKGVLSLTNKRLDDVNTHLVDQSRRIDALREELGARLNALREELSGRIDETNGRLGGIVGRIDETNKRLDRLYEVIVRREEHEQLSVRVQRLEQAVANLEKRIAA
ncbi:MAG: hypothetical protein PHW74_14805 [Desulfobacca sp.]|nr:hypothetical protein [Desulfobacca sp.]